jgi:hypothetical protein
MLLALLATIKQSVARQIELAMSSFLGEDHSRRRHLNVTTKTGAISRDVRVYTNCNVEDNPGTY